jgi:hypothetical protein
MPFHVLTRAAYSSQRFQSFRRVFHFATCFVISEIPVLELYLAVLIHFSALSVPSLLIQMCRW